MTKREVRDVTYCDLCGGTQCFDVCARCKKDVCYDCLRDNRRAVRYQHAVSFSGSDDAAYCLACDKVAREEGDALWRLYQDIQALRREYTNWNADFRTRSERTEARIASMRKERGLGR